MNTSIENLVSKYKHPFLKYLVTVRNMEFKEKPNYEYLRNLFESTTQDSATLRSMPPMNIHKSMSQVNLNHRSARNSLNMT